MAEPLEVTPRVRVLPAALEVHAVRSSGPGGQNDNKVSSKILLLVDLKYLYELFPYGPAKQACKIAGLPNPTGCV